MGPNLRTSWLAWCVGGLLSFFLSTVQPGEVSAAHSSASRQGDDPKPELPPELIFESTDPDVKEAKAKEAKAKEAKEKEAKEKEAKEKEAKEKEAKEKGAKEKGAKEKEAKEKGAKEKGAKEKGGKGKRVREEPFYYEYSVEEGDTLDLMARMYGVSVERLKRWNRSVLPRRGALKAGTVLKIYAQAPIRIKRKATYETQKGDTLKKLAKKLKMPEGELRSVNKLKSSKIPPGVTLVYLTSSTWPPSETLGKCSSGRLVNGEKLPAGPGYSFGSRPNIYGTNETVTLLVDVFGKFRKRNPRGPKIVVGNLSRSTGGPLSPHKSHQSGRDVDLGYVSKEEYQPITHMVNATEKNLDCEKTWFLLEGLIRTGKIDHMFVDFEVQKILYDYLVAKKYPKGKLRKYFQYPNRGTEAIIKHVQGHVHHVHVRFVCPKSDKECSD